MPIPEKYLAAFEENSIYHVYNRTNNKEQLFLSDENRLYFLNKYKLFLSPYLDTYCWCLMPTHFHLLVRVKPLQTAEEYLLSKEVKYRTLTDRKFLTGKILLTELISHSFRQLFQSYSLAFNKAYSRSGNLFYKPFKRVIINKESHFTQAVVYIHANAARHRMEEDFKKYKWSSWHSLLSASPTFLLRDEIMEWFGGRESFIKTHEQMAEKYSESDISIEE